jgi:alpha-amylase/alpha-mannosidase (GH57 family)
MDRYVCIHGHFYQPPRENPWLESIELQDSAYPYHDWNERVTAECYAANAVSRILDGERRITQIVNNYSKISFNFGPTLLSWMELNAPDVYQTILGADHESQQAFSGHGSALAQPFNHMIMPLASRLDKYTQVIWGIQDFQHRFGRKPEGMWLPETAVDIETLEVLAESGIGFTILAPRQAQRVRAPGSKEWKDVNGSNIDPTMAYKVRLPSGRTIALFFYEDDIARAVAFEGLLTKGEDFASRLVAAFSEARAWPQLVHIATDGETYGHHHRHGDMALAYALHYIESNDLAQITNYGEYLEKHPPTYEVEIIENTSWSCPHGIERWRNDCGCSSGAHPKWNQAWRAPLRAALDQVRDSFAPAYEQKGHEFLKDPWKARNDYIAVILDRSKESIERFLSDHAAQELNDAEKTSALKLLELQRHAMLMYTSCGWFFDELSGIETVQIIQYASRALQLAREVFGDATESHFLQLLEEAKCNVRQHGDGRRIYEKWVRPAMVDLTLVAAHYAVSALFEEYGEQAKVHCYTVDLADYQIAEAGKARLALGRAEFASQITLESALLSFGVLHFGDHNLNAGVREYQGEKVYQRMIREVTQAFSAAEFAQVIREMDKHFGDSTYSLRYLFRDEQRKVLEHILESTLAEVEGAYRQIYDSHYPLMLFITGLGNPLPRGFHGAAEFILNTDLSREFSADTLDMERIRGLLNDAWEWDIELDREGLGYLLKQTLDAMMERFSSAPEDISLLQELVAAVELARSLPFEVNLWKVQNLYYAMLQSTYPDLQKRAQQGDKAAVEWVAQFGSLGQQLSIQVA